MERLEIENGHVYKIIEEGSTIHSYSLGREYKLVPNLTTEKVDDALKITGLVYKEKYDGEVVEIVKDVMLYINNYSNNITITPNGGVIDVSLEIQDVNSVKTIGFKEKENVDCIIVLKEGEIIYERH